ncbi:hypothetical protein CYMTET_8862 [Cymbomonas tetramitiformis]|uniref:Uncharacterized protein n=1 Tax=Cymbomonas tetramitiformis TaxID=36881 RepID=A0AAE0LFF4_9CHLO|nr:hypothetical protein CYMTET_8862 [Cymbomonas tetramitiformis]
MSGQLKVGPWGSYGQPTEKNASTPTDITGVHTKISAADDVAGGRQDSGAVPTGGDLGHQEDILIEFQRLEEVIVGELPEELEGPTEDLVEVGLFTSNRRVVRGEWPLGEQGDRWEKLRGEARKERRHVMAWAAARLVETAVAAALEKRDARDRGSGKKGRESSPRSLRDLSKLLMGKRLGWTWSECERVIAEVRVAAAQQAADLVRVKRVFERHPAARVEPWAFGIVDERFPRCGQEQCGQEELANGEKV